jgi:DNA gyrase subunit A
VNGISLRGSDRVTSMDVVEPGGYLLVMSENGYGKRAALDDYPRKGRATGGVATADQKNLDRTGKIAVARVVQEEDEVTLISAGGTVLRMKVKDISQAGRATRGVRVMDLAKGDIVASLARISTASLERGAAVEVAAPAATKPQPEEQEAPAPSEPDDDELQPSLFRE